MGENRDSMILKSTFVAKVAISDSDEEANQWYFDQGLGEYLIGIFEPTNIFIFSYLVNVIHLEYL
ncbi:MAG: hypothetical protein WCF14_11845 [Nitrososphaeraceae archaeon]